MKVPKIGYKLSIKALIYDTQKSIRSTYYYDLFIVSIVKRRFSITVITLEQNKESSLYKNKRTTIDYTITKTYTIIELSLYQRILLFIPKSN